MGWSMRVGIHLRLWLFMLFAGMPIASLPSEIDDVSAARRAEALLQSFEQPDAPGCAVAVYRRTQRVFGGAFGYAELGQRRRLSLEHAFGVASMSKQFTAAALAIAADEGRLSLQDDVRKYLPELPDYGQPITLWQLVHHTAGLRDDGVLIELTGRPAAYRERAGIIELLARQRELNFAPGARFLYGNTGYMLIPEIIERATGTSFPQYAKSRIFAPLRMDRTHYLQRTIEDIDIATPYVYRKGRWAATEMKDELARIGNGGLITTLDDYSRWAANLLSAGETLRGGRMLIRSLAQPAELPDGSLTPYGFGLRISDFQGWRVWGHGGSGAGFKAHSMLFPELGLTVAGFCNNGVYAQPLVMQLAALFTTPRETIASNVPPQKKVELSRFEGTYREPELGWPMIVMREGSALRIDGDALSYLYRPVRGSYFAAEEGLEIEFLGGARPDELRQVGERSYGSGRFLRIRPVQHTSMSLRDFTGRFFSEELGVAYVAEIHDGKLTIRNDDAEAEQRVTIPLLPLLADEFVSIPQRWVLRFERGTDLSVKGFKLTAQFGWVRGVSFERSSTAALSWAKGAARPLRLDVSDDFSELAERLSGVTVVALGEANHDAHEFPQLRNQLFRYLVERHGFTAIAVESDYLRSLGVDDFVRGAPLPTDPQARAVMSWAYGSFRENRDLIEWMRNYNATAGKRRPLHFYGLEARGEFSYDGAPLLSAIVQYLQQVDPSAAAEFDRRFDRWRDAFNIKAYRDLPHARRERIIVDLQELLTLFEQWHVAWTEATSKPGYQRALRLVAAARQLEAELRTEGGGRDIASFDNLRWALEQEGPQGRILLYMHNLHVTRWRRSAPPDNPPYSSIGQHAADLLGDRLFVIGTMHDGGAIRHWLDLPGYDNCLRRLSAASSASSNAMLAKAGRFSYLLDLGRLSRQSAAFDGFNVESEVRNIDVSGGYSPLKLASSFDALIFIPAITPLRHDPADLRCH